MKKYKTEDLKQRDLLSYIELTVGQKATKVGMNTYKFKKCPVCGGGDHFTVNAEKNYFNTWEGCSKSGSIIDFYMVMNQVDSMTAITELIKNGSAELDNIKSKREKTATLTGATVHYSFDIHNLVLSKYIKCKNDRQYFYQRGLSDVVIEKYKLFKANPKDIFPGELLPNLSNIDCWEYIIPLWQDGKIVNCILRRNDDKCKYGNKAYNLKSLSLTITNLDYLNCGYKLVCVTEGVFDALTLETLGLKAIALNSVNMVNKLLDKIKCEEDIKFFLFGDNDKAGANMNKKLKARLKNCIVFDAYEGYKDINHFFVSDSKKLKENIKKVFNDAKRQDLKYSEIQDLKYKD